MLLRLRVAGFKNLLDVEVRFGAFTCIFGENGVGKSNLFDTIRLLALLADGKPFAEALQQLRAASGRSAPPESFLTHLGSWRAGAIELEADMLTAAQATDDFGNPASAQTRMLRYRLRLASDVGQLRLEEESLAPLRGPDAKTLVKPFGSGLARSAQIPSKRTPYLSTQGGAVHLHQDGHAGRKRAIPIGRSQRTVLGEAGDGTDFPTVLVARREMQSWHTLALEPSAMRSPSSYTDPASIDSRGSNIAATLYRLTRPPATPETVFARVANRLHRLLPEVRQIDLQDDPKAEQRTVRVRMADGIWYPARALSDGTLRFLVIATLAEDPTADGVLCLEEPENGIHPDRVAAIVDLLRQVGSTGQAAPALRQVIVNTHSPLVHHSVPADDRVWLELATALRDASAGSVAKVLVESGTWRAAAGAELLAPGDAAKWEQMKFEYEGDARAVAEE